MENPCDLWELNKVRHVPNSDRWEEYWEEERAKGVPEAIDD